MITAVTGLTRSGTSLMMQMLRHGGLEIYCDPDKQLSGETSRIFNLPGRHSWLKQVDGKAIKFLDPQHYFPLPGAYDYRFILMTRDSVQQARSMMKFMTEVGGLSLLEGAERTLADSIAFDIARVEHHIATRGPVLKVSFEELLECPDREAGRVADFVDLSRHWTAMAGIVLNRSPECFDGLLELQLEQIYELADRYGVSAQLIYERVKAEMAGGRAR